MVEKIQKIIRGVVFLAGRMSALLAQALGLSLRISLYARNRFELWRKMPPKIAGLKLAIYYFYVIIHIVQHVSHYPGVFMEIFDADTKAARINRERKKEEDKQTKGLKNLTAVMNGLVHDIVNTARSTYIKDGKMRAVLDLDFPKANDLVGCERAQQLIKLKLELLDPSLEIAVKIGPDMSGKWNSKPELVVEFTPKAE